MEAAMDFESQKKGGTLSVIFSIAPLFKGSNHKGVILSPDPFLLTIIGMGGVWCNYFMSNISQNKVRYSQS